MASFPAGGNTSPIYTFGRYRLDPGRRLLARDGEPVPLTPKAFDTLVLLVENDGRLLSKDEMMTALWPDTFVTEANLTQMIFKLRRALGDAADGQPFIVTVPGRGYRFGAVAERASADRWSDAAVDDGHVVDRPPGPPAAPRRRMLAAAAVGLFAIATAVIAQSLSASSRPRVVRFVQPAQSQRVEPWQKLVSDGTRVYFLERTAGSWTTMQTSIAGGPPAPFQGPFPSFRIFDVSPNGAEFLVAGFAATGSPLPLWTWSAPGGAPVRVGTLTVDEAIWSPDARDIVYARENEIHRVRRDGNDDRVIVRAPGRADWIRWSPDGTALSYMVTATDTGSRSLWIADTRGGNVRPRFPNEMNRSICCGEWTRDGRYFMFAKAAEGVYNLWAVREGRSLRHWRGGEPVQLTTGARSIFSALPIGAGSRAFVYVDALRSETVTYSPATAEYVRLFGDLNSLDVAFSPAGDVAAVQRIPDWTLWRATPSGSERLQLVGEQLRASHPQWSPDGERIAFEGRQPPGGNEARAYVVSARGGPAEELVPALKGYQSQPFWSPDGKSLALALNAVEDLRDRVPSGVFVLDLRTRRTTKVPGSDGLTSPQWSPDGRHFIAKTPDDDRILRFDAASNTWVTVVEGTRLIGPWWSDDSTRLYVQHPLEAGQPVYRISVATLQREKVASFESTLSQGVQRCVLKGVMPGGALLVRLVRTGTELFAVDLDLPR